jgi:hypothetical protein
MAFNESFYLASMIYFLIFTDAYQTTLPKKLASLVLISAVIVLYVSNIIAVVYMLYTGRKKFKSLCIDHSIKRMEIIVYNQMIKESYIQ